MFENNIWVLGCYTWAQEDVGTKGEILVFCRYSLQLEASTIINGAIQEYTSKYTICMKFLIQECRMIEIINYIDQSKCS